MPHFHLRTFVMRFSDGLMSRWSDDPILDTLPPPTIPISKALTRFIPIDPQGAHVENKAENPIHPHSIPIACKKKRLRPEKKTVHDRRILYEYQPQDVELAVGSNTTVG